MVGCVVSEECASVMLASIQCSCPMKLIVVLSLFLFLRCLR